MRKEAREYFKFLLLAACAYFATSFIVFSFPVLPLRLNDLSGQYLYRLTPSHKRPAVKFIAIEVDNYSVAKLGERFPLRRSTYARLLKVLDSEQAGAVGFDFVFTGESEAKNDDLIFKEVLKGSSVKVLLSYFFDAQKKTANLPLADFQGENVSLGMLNMPHDADGVLRRARTGIKFENQAYYSFSVALAAAYSGEAPQEIVSQIRALKDSTFYVNYLLKPKDITRVSLYDCLENLAKLKEKYGAGFLNRALVLVYPQGQISHDVHATPLGRMEGGAANINSINTILGKKYLYQNNPLSLAFFILLFVAVWLILRNLSFLAGLLFSIGALIFFFWCNVALRFGGQVFDYAEVVIFGALFFISGSIYKYAVFLTQLIAIKIKATTDPLRKTFTLRYFYYRLELELKKISWRKVPILLYVRLESFSQATRDLDNQSLKDLWKRIQEAIALRGSFWASFSPEELLGCVVVNPAKINSLAITLKDALSYVLQENKIKAGVKIGYLSFKKDYPFHEAVFLLSQKLKNGAGDVAVLSDAELLGLSHANFGGAKESIEFLGGLSEDIEEKNRQLLGLIENLNLQHAKTRQAFIEVIASLARALEARDSYTEGHSERVARYAEVMAIKLGWEDELKEKLHNASLLHDLGKIGIPDSTLHKAAKLSEEEFQMIKKHELLSVKILEPLKELKDILPWIMHHHEKWDGSGYPHGLAGNNIPLGAQIIALADVFDAITTGRDYKLASSSQEAIAALNKAKGTHFNPELVDLFIETIKEKQA